MYGSYGSYSSFPSSPITSATSSPLDISPSTMRSDTCAFPSWPRRSALSDASCAEPRASSYLSDDDLFPTTSSADEDDLSCLSSAGSSFSSPVAPVQVLSGSQLMEMERQRKEAAREYLKVLISEKEKKRAAKKGRRGSGGSSKKSKKSMAPISEGSE